MDSYDYCPTCGRLVQAGKVCRYCAQAAAPPEGRLRSRQGVEPGGPATFPGIPSRSGPGGSTRLVARAAEREPSARSGRAKVLIASGMVLCAIVAAIVIWAVHAGASGGPTATTAAGAPFSLTTRMYDSIQLGMSYAQVTGIIGMPGTLQPPSPPDPRVGTATFSWGDANGSSLTVVFQDNRVTDKSGDGLR